MAAAARSRSPHGHTQLGMGLPRTAVPLARPGLLTQAPEAKPLHMQLTQQVQQHLLHGQQLQLQQPMLQQQQQQQKLPAPSLQAATEGKAEPEQDEAAQRAAAEEKEAREQLQRSIENNEGYFNPTLGQVLVAEDSKYTVVSGSPLGIGVFSVVWPCADKDNKLVALKVVRSQNHFRKYAGKEVEMLRRAADLSDNDPEGSAQVAMLRDHFIHSCTGPTGPVEHLCMAFEKLESNLRSIGKQPLSKVLAFSKQILRALRFLHDFVGLVHCDVKPDNLLLRWDGLGVKLCDFGTARFSSELQDVDELQPLFYRAPEVFLGSTRGRKIDIWSAGCTIYELVVGRILMRSCNSHREVVERMMQLRGAIPKSVREQGRLANAYFSPKGFHPEVGEPVDPDKVYVRKPLLGELAPYVNFGSAQGQSAQNQARAQLSRLIGRTTVVSAATKKSGGPTEGEKKLKELSNLLESLMEVDPGQRITAALACEHDSLKSVELPPAAELQEAPPLPEEAPPPLPPTEGSS